MNSHSTATGVGGPKIGRWTPTPTAIDARAQLISWTLRTAAREWEGTSTSLPSSMFVRALAILMAEVAPHMTVTPYGYGESATDEAYVGIQKAALGLAFIEWDNGRETANELSSLDHADDQLDEALDAYLAAASSTVK